MDLLKRSVSGLDTEVIVPFSILWLIKSFPHALLVCKMLTISLISDSLMSIVSSVWSVFKVNGGKVALASFTETISH